MLEGQYRKQTFEHNERLEDRGVVENEEVRSVRGE